MQSLKKYIQFLQTLNEATALYTHTQIKYISPQLAQLLEYPDPSALIDTTPYAHIHPEELIDLEKNLETRTRTHRNTQGTWTLRNNNGTYTKVYAKGSTITLQDTTYFLSTFTPCKNIDTPTYTNAKIKHDILTPLTAAKGYLEILETHLNTPETHHLLDQAMKNCDKIETKIKDIIENSKQLNQIIIK